MNVGHSASPSKNNYIWVDKFGSRFINENDSRINPHKGWMMFTQFDNARATFPYIPHYLVFDETVRLAGPLDSFGSMGGGPPAGAARSRACGRELALQEVKAEETHGRSRSLLRGRGGSRAGCRSRSRAHGRSGNQTTWSDHGLRVSAAALGGVESWSKDNSEEIKKGWIKKAETLEELAKAIGSPMDAATLKATVEAYNASCDAKEDKEFGRNARQLAPIKTAPFYAVPLYPGLVCTEGGPAINANFRWSTRTAIPFHGSTRPEPTDRLSLVFTALRAAIWAPAWHRAASQAETPRPKSP